LRHLYINPRVEELTWMPPPSFLGKTARELGYSDELLASFEEVCGKVFETGEVKGLEFDLAVPDGRIKHLESRIVPEFARDGAVESIMVVTRDVTQRKQAEQELTSYMQRLELLNQELRDFAYAASHDLQEPLRKIQTFASQISSKQAANLDDEGKDFLLRMQRTANRMSSLLDALHRYSHSTTCSVPFTPTDLTIVAEEAVSDLEDKIKERGASVEIGKLPTACVDPLQFRLLLRHLIGNGMQYAGDRKPEVKVFGEELDNGECRIHVEDNGIGFEAHHLRKIFAPFQRLHGRSSPYDGIGMGLAICRKIVERHGGTITAKSTPGEGSTFTVTVPALLPRTGTSSPALRA
jgi:PAS domain S-box-containing protein